MKKYLNNLRNLINENIKNELLINKSDNLEINDMLEYAVLLGGKRIRPIIMYILADIYKKDYKLIEKEAVAIELLHAYSLVHDDLPCMDNDDYRRGNLTLHRKYGEANAVLIGDALLTLSFYVLASSNYSNKNSIMILSYYSGHKSMILGQYLDMFYSNRKIDYANLMEIHINKTAMLLMAAVEIASISLKLDQEARKLLRKYMFYLGLAYQVQDDILEVKGSFEKIGKLNTDERNKKQTFVSLFGLEESEKMRNKFIEEAISIVEDKKILIDFAKYLLNRES